jgi:uncharacterized protein (DUF433 family)
MENLLNRITSNPDICFGKPVIRGTRMAVVFLMEHLAAGGSQEDILSIKNYQIPNMGIGSKK